MRLPLHPFFAAVLNHFGLAPGQLSPNGGRAMAGFVALSRSAGVDPSLAVFRHFFALCPFPPHGFYTLRGKDADGLLFARIRAKFVKGWKEDFFFLESSAPWPCPVEWGEPSRSSTFDPSLTVQEKAVADSLLRARGSSPIDLFAYLHHRNMAAANITGVVSSPPPTRKAAPVHVAMEEAAAARASAGKVTVKSEPGCKVPPCAPSPGKKRKLPEDRADGESSASFPSCPPGFSAPCKSPPTTSKDGDWKAARRLL
uniref:Transposase (putative) gypsy type domain-containing protein n=2 Tax=Aegilops tauschii subsp. strangulata TaxID=200361 RepID=A0A453QWW0_AEGTS